MAKPAFGIRVDGLQELNASLNDLGKRLGQATLERAMRKAANPMLTLAKDLAPRDEGDLEGSLKIARQTLFDPGKAAYSAVMSSDRPGEGAGNRGAALAAMREAYRTQGGAVVDLVLGPDLLDGGRHAHLVEFGTGPRYHKGGKFVGAMPAEPFLRPAFDAQAGPTVDRLKPILAAEIDKAVTRRAARLAKAAARTAGQ
jgi:HK97 gp10 family phage protein